MTIVLPLIFISLAAGAAALIAFLWTVSTGQYDDLQGAAARVLLDDETDEDAPDESCQSTSNRFR